MAFSQAILNAERSPEITMTCACGGRMSGCAKCDGVGSFRRKSCRRCGGTGRDGSRCPDCRGEGFREVDSL